MTMTMMMMSMVVLLVTWRLCSSVCVCVCLSVCLFVCACVFFLVPLPVRLRLRLSSTPFSAPALLLVLFTRIYFLLPALHFARPPNSVHNPLGVLLLRLSDKMHLMHKESTEPSVHLHLRLSLTTKSSTQQGAGVEVGSGKMHVGLAKTSRRILRTIEVVPRFWVSDSLRSSSSPAPASAHPPT